MHFFTAFFVRSIIRNKRSTDVGEIEDDQVSKKRKTCSETGVLSQVSELNAAKSANIEIGASGRYFINC